MAQQQSLDGPAWLGWGIVGTGVVLLLVFWAFLYVVAL